jgi:hypothetical protein
MAKLSRKNKERGYSIYKTIVHLVTITLLFILYRSLYITQDGNHWFYGIGIVYFILRLAIFSSRERNAASMGIPITEYMEMSIEEKRNKINNNNKND